MAKKTPLKSVKFEQAGDDGRITEVTVMVTPTSGDFLTFPFTKERKEKRQYLAQAESLVNAAFTERRNRLEASTATAGEIDIVSKKIDADRKKTLSFIRGKNYTTLKVLVQTFNEDRDSLQRLEKVLDDVHLIYEGHRIREAIVFNAEIEGKYFSLMKPLIDNLRSCHPALAREDLSELDSDLLESVRKLLRMSIESEERAQHKHWGNSTKGEFSKEINNARSEIIRVTRHMTPSLASVVIDHPEKLELVLKTLDDRGVPVHQADDLIQEIVDASTPLSAGAL